MLIAGCFQIKVFQIPGISQICPNLVEPDNLFFHFQEGKKNHSLILIGGT